VSSTYRKVFSSERDIRLCSSRELALLASQRLTWDKLKRPKNIPEDFTLATLPGVNLGEGPPKRSPLPQWSSMILSCIGKQECQGHMCPGVDTGVNQRTLGLRHCFWG
jgi:hypothetical protein